MVAGPVGDLARFAGKYGYLMTYFLLGPVSIKMFPSLWLPVLCFAPNTPIYIKKNQIVKIENIKLGNKLLNGEKVIGILVFLNLHKDLYNLDGDIVSGNHLVFHNKQWIPVEQHPHAEPYKKKCSVLRNIITDTHTLCTPNHSYRDWEEYSDEKFNIQCKNKILSILRIPTSIQWSCNHLYPEGFYFLKQSLRKTYQVKLGQSASNNIIIGKSITISNYIRWYYPKNQSIQFLVSGSTIGWCDISNTWLPIYSHPEYLPYIHSRPSIILHYMTLTGNIIINNRKFKDLLEIRSQQYEDDYQKNVLNKLNICE
jgi:hypothetical protein